MKSILVPLFGIESDNQTLRFARLVGSVFGSHIACLHVRPGLREMALATASVETAGIITQELWDSLDEEDRDLTASAAKAYEDFGKQCGAPICDVPAAQTGMTRSYREITGDCYEQIAAIGRAYDVIVFSRENEAFAPTTGKIGDVLMRCGRPILMASRHEQAAFGRHVAIAWKDSAEAARAVAAAMPLLRKAKTVTILSAIENASEQAAVTGSATRLANELKWHGLSTAVRVIDATHSGATASITEAALKGGCDLLVMGAYGHSRVMEFVLGGVTRDILNEARLPVLLFH
jgi:nucleotide-binding universal stress UspA family protein